MKINRKILIGLGLVMLIVVVFVAYVVREALITQDKIDRGLLVKYEGEWYTAEELNAKYPQSYDTPAKNTQLEAYASFRSAIMAGDIDKAKEYMTEKAIAEYEQELRRPEDLKDYQDYLPEADDLQEDETLGNYSEWDYILSDVNNVEDGTYGVSFEKSREGYWKVSFF